MLAPRFSSVKPLPSTAATGPVSFGASEPDTRMLVGDRRVGVGHLERRHALLETAEQHGRVGGQLGADPHPVREPGHCRGLTFMPSSANTELSDAAVADHSEAEPEVESS